MGARELLHDLAGAGLSVTAQGDRLVIRPAGKLTDDMRAALLRAKPALLAILAPAPRPYRLPQGDADRCHYPQWNDAEIATFVARVALFLRRGMTGTDADDLAERLVLRDRDGDDMHVCVECAHYRPGRCGNHRRAMLQTSEVGRDLAGLLQRCPGYQGERL